MSEPFIGEIRLFGGNFAPVNFAFCNGALQSIAQNNALYALIGTTYGGDGVNTFGLPDLRGRLPLGQGQGPGLTNRTIGEISGTESVTLQTTQIPSHTHQFYANRVRASLPQPGPTAQPAKAPQSPGGESAILYVTPGTAPINLVAMNPSAIATAGGSQPHENLMPLLAINFIIALYGVFPSRN